MEKYQNMSGLGICREIHNGASGPAFKDFKEMQSTETSN